MIMAFVCRAPHAILAVIAILAGLVWAGGTARAASLVVDVETGQVIASDAPNHLWYPASLTKMMTVYVALSEIEAGRLSFDDKIKVSSYAAGQSPVKFGLKAGQVITVRQAINAAIVASGNDAAVALAEKMAGSEEAFAARMTAMARDLGMARTVFRNASGLPHDGQVTTARDMAVLATALLRDYPKHYPLFNQRAVTIGKRSRGTVNGILGSYAGADGFKTGFTCGSGYNLVASATRDGRRVIGVVLGSANRGQRTIDMTGLLNRAFAANASKGSTLAELGQIDHDRRQRAGPNHSVGRQVHGGGGRRWRHHHLGGAPQRLGRRVRRLSRARQGRAGAEERQGLPGSRWPRAAARRSCRRPMKGPRAIAPCWSAWTSRPPARPARRCGTRTSIAWPSARRCSAIPIPCGADHTCDLRA